MRNEMRLIFIIISVVSVSLNEKIEATKPFSKISNLNVAELENVYYNLEINKPASKTKNDGLYSFLSENNVQKSSEITLKSSNGQIYSCKIPILSDHHELSFDNDEDEELHNNQNVLSNQASQNQSKNAANFTEVQSYVDKVMNHLKQQDCVYKVNF